MGMFKADFTRFFLLGFAGGAALVASAVFSDQPDQRGSGLIPPAQAAVVETPAR